MKIAYYLPSLQTPGGLERIITFKANYFAEHFEDYSITIITSEQVGNAPYFPLSSKVRHIDIDVPFDWPYNQSRLTKLIKYPFRYSKFKKKLTQTLLELDVDITISTLRRELNFINSIPDRSVKIGEFHVTRNSYQAQAIKSRNPIIKILKDKWAKTFLRNLSKLTKLVILTYEEEANWPELKNTIIIPNPIIIPSTGTTKGEYKQVIAVGRYMPQKGFDLLIDSWAIVTQKHPSWKLCIYGEGMRQELQTQIDKLGLTKTCILEHTVPNINDKYCESSIFVLSSRFEGFGMVIIEAMACGVPPVSFDCPCGPRDIIKDSVDGLLVQCGNIEQLAEKISYLIEHENIRKEMGRQALINVQRYQMENIAVQWEKLFESLLKEKTT